MMKFVEVFHNPVTGIVLTKEEYYLMIIREIRYQGVDPDLKDIDRSMSEDTDYTLAYECRVCGEIVRVDEEHNWDHADHA